MPNKVRDRRNAGQQKQRASRAPTTAERAEALRGFSTLPPEARVDSHYVALLLGKSVEALNTDIRCGRLRIEPAPECATARKKRFSVKSVREALAA